MLTKNLKPRFVVCAVCNRGQISFKKRFHIEIVLEHTERCAL